MSMDTANLFCGNLSWEIDDADLRKLFEVYGVVINAHVIIDRESGHSRGYGFVEMQNIADGERATMALNGSVVMGRPLRIDKASRSAHSPRN